MFTIGTGIGGAVVTEGAIYYGQGIAGQLGHLSVASSGPTCRCGRIGCVETFSSGAILNSYMAEAGIGTGMKADDLLAMAQSGDRSAADVLERWVDSARAGHRQCHGCPGPRAHRPRRWPGTCRVEALESHPRCRRTGSGARSSKHDSAIVRGHRGCAQGAGDHVVRRSAEEPLSACPHPSRDET